MKCIIPPAVTVINTALPHFVSAKTGRKQTPMKSAVFRFCMEMRLLHASQIALTTFCRFVREYEPVKDALAPVLSCETRSVEETGANAHRLIETRERNMR